MRLMSWLCLAVFAVSESATAQSLHYYGGVGMSVNRFMPDRQSMPAGSGSWHVGPIFSSGLRYHTLQNFDLLLDLNAGITGINGRFPAPGDGTLRYEQFQGSVLFGAGLYLPLDEEQALMPFVQLGASFLDFWQLHTANTSYQMQVATDRDFDTNRWLPVVAVGADYSFQWGLPSSLRVRVMYTPLNVFSEPVSIPYRYSGQDGAAPIQGKLLQVQLSYHVQVPIFKGRSEAEQW